MGLMFGTSARPGSRGAGLPHPHTMAALRGEGDQFPWTADMHLSAWLLEAQQWTNHLLDYLLQAHGASSNPVQRTTDSEQ
jgi:hypothetical protein